MENKDKEAFNYMYSAKEQKEILEIRKKYITPEVKEDKIEHLRRLDEAVTQKATTVSLIFGIVGALMLGIGMSLAMTELVKILNLSNTMSMLVGVLVGIIGIVLVSIAYPVYNRILRHERKKIAPEIIKLTDELMK